MDHMLEVFDEEFDVMRMCAAVDNCGIAMFTLRTIVPNNIKSKFPYEKHPDMFAKKFVGTALEHFKDAGKKVEICRGRWNPDSINFNMFMKSMKKDGDVIHAAKNTWSGKTFMDYGFTSIENIDVIYGLRQRSKQKTKLNIYIQADFCKTKA